MNTAIVFINAEVDQVPEVAEALAAIPGVTEVYSVTGAIDLVAIIRTRTVDEIADIVTGRMNKVPGVADTQTHLAFRAYSAHDLEAAFSLGD
ncbi:Lrp/AsnC ligand binding domain-containing protein [Propioniciclava soli]|uniref:Lrp/AsnC ligand binding domain-containing protein n=1 Tax=Propioniciclava soli TaxID=2775081 RepID=A0ABZ3C5A6_9ACTN